MLLLVFSACDVRFMGMKSDPYDQLSAKVDHPERIKQGQPFELKVTVENNSPNELVIPNRCHLSARSYVNNEFTPLRGLGGGCSTARDHELQRGESFTYTYDMQTQVYAGDGEYAPAPPGNYELTIEAIRQEEFPEVVVNFEVI